MSNEIRQLFDDKMLVSKIKVKLPQLFHLAELESSRAGKIGMEVGSVREKIISALPIYKFGEENIETELPVTEAEVDVKLFGNPISVKTFTGKTPAGIKLIWTVDPQKALEFSKTYTPSCDMLLVQIDWNNGGGLYYISKETQIEALNMMGREKYIKLPKQGTNPRGVEMSGDAMRLLIANSSTLSIPISWKKETIQFNPFERWVDLWQKD
ncbi:hypothetical protein FACS1894172_18600 [Spirochaetia bacterium]|nr:hypothetical protein FACS1894164_02490 [Spirochaetia bacterium]GHU36079.1 hypothetical protein FACS1894172_18600 [Spirochaetia bacterium]